MFLDNGVDPRAADTMSLYEIVSTMHRLKKMRSKNGEGEGKKYISDSDFDSMLDGLRNMPDVRI